MADKEAEGVAAGFTSSSDDEATPGPATAGAGGGLTPALQQQIELRRRRAIALRAKKQAEREAAAAAVQAAEATLRPVRDGAAADAAAPPGKRRKRDAGASAWRKDTQAGFFLAEEDEDAGPAAGQGHESAAAAELAPEIDNPFYPAHPKCKDCNAEFWNSQLQVQFGVMVCDKCQAEHKEGRYSLITKTAAKADYLLRESDLGGLPDSLRFIEKKNRRNEKWARIKLYLLAEVEARSFSLYGGEEGLDAEFDKREAAKKTRAVVKQTKVMKKLRKDTLTARWMKEPEKHEHEYGAENHNAEDDTWSRVCNDCGHVDVYEKM